MSAGLQTSGPGVDAFRTAFRQPSEEPLWLSQFRLSQTEQFSHSGLPTTKDEGWKYTSLRPLARAKYQIVEACEGGSVPPILKDAAQAVFVNGYFRAEASDISGLEQFLGPFNGFLKEPWLENLVTDTSFKYQTMYSLNAASFTDGFALKLGADQQLPRPLELVFLSVPGDVPGMWHPRAAIDLGANASATIIERHLSVGKGAYLANHAADIRVGENARLVHVKIQDEGSDGRHLSMTRVKVGKKSLYDGFTLTIGGSLSRSETEACVEGVGAEVRLNGAYSITGKQHADHTSRINHLAQGTKSRQVYAGAIDGNGRGVFQGHIVVDQAAQQTDGYQMNRALLLSDTAEVDSKPTLEIYADDVKCSHGATAGDIDEDHLFYLRARGIPAPAARSLVVRGFLADPIENISDDDARAAVLDVLDAHLGLERL
ncbi:MAG: Fe-S cluster assembly protein SufD [Alphaproteobacteria bacterium]